MKQDNRGHQRELNEERIGSGMKLKCSEASEIMLSAKLIYIMLRISQKGFEFTCFWRKEPRCRGGAEGQREEGEGGEKMNHRC